MGIGKRKQAKRLAEIKARQERLGRAIQSKPTGVSKAALVALLGAASLANLQPPKEKDNGTR